jgi:hypothetical protein
MTPFGSFLRFPSDLPVQGSFRVLHEFAGQCGTALFSMVHAKRYQQLLLV